MEAANELPPGDFLSRKWLRRTVVALLIASHFGLVFFSVRHKSATSDEPYHLARGVSSLFSGDFRMAVAHPPLINIITAMPLLFFRDLQLPFGDNGIDLASWHDPSVDPAERKNKFCFLLLWVHDIPAWKGNSDPLAIIFWSRLTVMVLSSLLALSLYLATVRAVGVRAGIGALTLYCFSPTIIAQAGLITTDVGGALTIFLFGLALAWHLEAPSYKRLLLCGLTFGLAQLSKYTAILVIPLIPIAFLAAAQGNVKDRAKAFFAWKPEQPGFHSGFLAYAAIILMGMFIIWAGLGFEIRSIHDFEIPPPVPVSNFGPFVKGKIIRMIAALPLVPKTYYYGLCRTMVDTTLHSHPLFFFGKESAKGWWYYYPVMFLIKEPVSLLALGALSLALLFQKKVLPRPQRMVTLTMSIGILLFFMFLNQKNIGLRHVIPLYPFAFMLMAGLFEPRIVANQWVRRAGWGLLGIYAANAFLSYPDYLVHFNYLVGGPDGGLHYSVVGDDWGQDIWALGDYCKKNDIKQIYYNPYGNADPRAYGVPYKKFKCDEPIVNGWYAIHVVQLRRPKADVGQECSHYFLEGKPVAILHHTIYVYEITTGKAPP